MSCVTQPVPTGWKVWRQTAVPDPLVQFAIDVRDHINKYPLGSIAKTIVYNGQTVGAFVSLHSWTWRNGQLLTGICIHGVSLIVQQAGVGGEQPVQDNLDTPDPTAAVYSAETPPPETTNWPLVTVSAGAIVGVAALVAFAIKRAGKAGRR